LSHRKPKIKLTPLSARNRHLPLSALTNVWARPNDDPQSHNFTVCPGCGKLIEATMGVVEKRCDDCFSKGGGVIRRGKVDNRPKM
jgi:hypothetical protein